MTRLAQKRTPYDDAVETELSQWRGVTLERPQRDWANRVRDIVEDSL